MRARRLKRNEKEFLSKKGLKAENWLVAGEDKENIIFIHKTSNKTRKFAK